MGTTDEAETIDALARFGITPNEDELPMLRALRAAALANVSAVEGHREPLLGLWSVAARASDRPGAGPAMPEPVPSSAAISSYLDQMRRGETTSADLVDVLLARADEVDGQVGAYVARFDDAARTAATEADKRRATGDDRPLLGIPIAVKDLIATAEGPTSAQSRVTAFDRRFDAECVRRLRAAGAIVIGKTTLNEHAMGRVDFDSPFPLPRHPRDPQRWPGGSSSGSASGVAAGLFPAALGSDTGGSIRIPASFCGIAGFKPTFGTVDTTGVAPLSWTSDTIGPMATTAVDCALLFQVLADDLSVHAPAPMHCWRGDLRGVRIAVDSSWRSAPGLQSDVASGFEAACARLARAGAELHDVDLTPFDIAGDAAGVAQAVEVFDHHRHALAERWDDYGPGVRCFLAMGAFYDGATYVRAQRVRAERTSALADQLAGVDAVVSPTVGLPAPLLTDDHAALIPLFFTKLWNATGFPALSVPMGHGRPAGGPSSNTLPLGLQIAGLPRTDLTVLAIGAGLHAAS
jgi:aspartyl-tRNA(Asn)/glutamyl-tRNA(Gln) amidotransferase subunit A